MSEEKEPIAKPFLDSDPIPERVRRLLSFDFEPLNSKIIQLMGDILGTELKEMLDEHPQPEAFGELFKNVHLLRIRRTRGHH